jgi:hypothetical protein
LTLNQNNGVVASNRHLSFMDLQHGLLLGFIGCTFTVIGFFIAYIVAIKVVFKKKNKLTNALDDLNKNMPGWKGDDCQ